MTINRPLFFRIAFLTLILQLSACVSTKKYQDIEYKMSVLTAEKLNSDQERVRLKEDISMLKRDTSNCGASYREIYKRYSDLVQSSSLTTSQLTEQLLKKREELEINQGKLKVNQGKLKDKEKELEEKAKLLIKEAEIQAEKVKNERILESKEKYLRLKAEFEDDVNKRKQVRAQGENRIKQREQQLAKQLEAQYIQVTEDTPVFTVLKPVTVPIEKSKPKRFSILFMWMIAGVFIGTLVVFGVSVKSSLTFSIKTIATSSFTEIF